MASPRILYFGTQGSFSLPPLLALLRAEQRVVGVVIPDIARQSAPSADIINLLPTTSNDTIIARTHTHAIPVWSLSNLPTTLEFELLIVACFPRCLPQSLLNRATIAALNMHPSRLPAYRGPAPLFWQLRNGLREIGVTLHHMTSCIDAGDIVTQTGVALPVGISGSAADELLAGAGADVDAPDTSGRTPLHRAMFLGRVEAAEVLILLEADTRTGDLSGRTPLDIARQGCLFLQRGR